MVQYPWCEKYEFGQAILMLLDRSEDIVKPRLIASIVSAHIEGRIEYSKAIRLCAIIGRWWGHLCPERIQPTFNPACIVFNMRANPSSPPDAVSFYSG